jgi:hypothetical protein
VQQDAKGRELYLALNRYAVGSRPADGEVARLRDYERRLSSTAFRCPLCPNVRRFLYGSVEPYFGDANFWCASLQEKAEKYLTQLPDIWRQVGLRYAGWNAGADDGAVDENVSPYRIELFLSALPARAVPNV